MSVNDLGISLSQVKAKHVLGVKTLFLISGKHAGHQRCLDRSTTPHCRGVVSKTIFGEMKSGKSGFPFEEQEEHEHEEHKEHKC